MSSLELNFYLVNSICFGVVALVAQFGDLWVQVLNFFIVLLALLLPTFHFFLRQQQLFAKFTLFWLAQVNIHGVLTLFRRFRYSKRWEIELTVFVLSENRLTWGKGQIYNLLWFCFWVSTVVNGRSGWQWCLRILLENWGKSLWTNLKGWHLGTDHFVE